jgi:hypothetical protein
MLDLTFGGMHNFIGNRIEFDFFSIGSSALGIGCDKINKNSIGSDKKDKIPIGSDSRVQKPILATANFFKVKKKMKFNRIRQKQTKRCRSRFLGNRGRFL